MVIFNPYKKMDILYHTYVVSLNDYDIENFNCQHYSIELRERLKDYNVLFVAGYSKDDEYYIIKTSNTNIEQFNGNIPKGYMPHEWIYIVDYDLYIEATNGSIIRNIYK